MNEVASDALRFERNVLPERMDDPALDAALHLDALRGLSRVNRISGVAKTIWKPIARLVQHRRSESNPLTLLDVACGGGDVTIHVAKIARNRGLPLRIRACDLSERALEFARKSANRAAIDIEFFQHDALARDRFPSSDIVICSLFLHHLPDDQLMDVLKKLAGATRKLLVIQDLRRCHAGLLAAQLGTRLLSRNPVVRFDGPQSVRAALSIDEFQGLSREAKLDGATIDRCFPFRMQLEWMRT